MAGGCRGVGVCLRRLRGAAAMIAGILVPDLLAEIGRLKAENEQLRNERWRLRQVLSDCYDAVPNWKTGRNDGLLMEIADALEILS
jgi:hypothetical protein